MKCGNGKRAASVQGRDIETVFHACFSRSFRVRLTGGHIEPLYLPTAGVDSHAEIRYREDYVSSALHEVAHWCIAGQARRQQTDYGYWYAPDGRSPGQQAAFERVEVKPQALEWIFSNAVGIRFHISADNLNNEALSFSTGFKEAGRTQVFTYLDTGLPPRAGRFVQALAVEFESIPPLDPACYQG